MATPESPIQNPRVVSHEQWVSERVAFMAKELDLTPDYARRGWEYYIENKIWPIDAGVNVEGVNVATQIFWESSQMKGPVPSSQKYIDQSYQKEALKELGGR